MNKIVLATDGSEHSQKAANKVVSLVGNQESYQLTVLHVIDYDASKHDVIAGLDAFSIKADRERKLLPVTDILVNEGLQYDLKIVKGEPSQTIIDTAQELNADVIVIGSRGLNALQELVLGSVSHQIVQKSDRPVLIVK